MECEGTYEVQLVCCGVAVGADVEAVQRIMTQQALTAEAQAREWLRLSHSFADPVWMEECRRRARRMAEAMREEREILTLLGDSVESASTGGAVERPVGELAERHFEWLGRQKKVPVEVVRDDIARLARSGFISNDMAQQEALRRGLGITCNPAERSERAPWVRWLGDADALHYLVTSLWEMGLIYCSGGERDKWETLCGIFLRRDGSFYQRRRIKSCYCRNARKRSAIDEAMLDGLRFVSGWEK